MDWYYFVALIIIIPQLIILIQAFSNYRFVLNKYKKRRLWDKLQVVLIVPCKGLDSCFHKNIASFFHQDYKNYSLWFVVAEKSDPAYAELCKLRDQLGQNSNAHEIQILIADKSYSCGQKIHNLLYAIERIDDSVEIIALADSDACGRPDWLSHLIYPLRKSKNGVTSGYRWFVPQKNNLASVALSVVNAKIVQLLGNTRFNHAWGGSMAIRVDVFHRLGIDKIWTKALSDDYTISNAVKKAGMKVAFVPACLMASHETTTWKNLFEFARRQFLITRVNALGMWWFGLFSSIYSVVGLWGTIALAIWDKSLGTSRIFFTAIAALFFLSQMCRAILRQKMAARLFEEDRNKMKFAMVADILFFWVWSILLLLFIVSSAFGRTICWRGIRYKLISPIETIVIGPKLNHR